MFGHPNVHRSRDGAERHPAKIFAFAGAGKAALETLAARGINDDERSRLRKLVKIAQSEPSFGDIDPNGDANDAALVDDLVELRMWFKDWSETARAAITRREYLLMLGLAQRKTGQEEAGWRGRRRGRRGAHPRSPEAARHLTTPAQRERPRSAARQLSHCRSGHLRARMEDPLNLVFVSA